MAGSAELSDSKTISPTNVSFADENVQRQSGIRRMGYLKKLKTMKKKFYVLREPTVDQPALLEYYDSERLFRKGTTPKKPSIISGAFAINRKEDCKAKHAISIFTSTNTHSVVANSEREQNEWLRDFLELQRSAPGQMLSFDASQKLNPRFDYVWNVEIMEKGLAADRKITGSHRLCLSERIVRLFPMNPSSDTDAFIFPLVKLRKVGHNDMYFYLEVGRHACTGGGEFCMQAEGKQSAQHIHEIISEAMRKGGTSEESSQQTSGHRTRSNTDSQRPRQTPEVRRNTFDTAKDKSQTDTQSEAGVKPSGTTEVGSSRSPRQVAHEPQTPEYIVPEFAHSASVEENYLPIDMNNAYLPCDFGNKQGSPFEQRATNYSSVVKPSEMFANQPFPSTSVNEPRSCMSPSTIPEEPGDYMTINMPASGSQNTLHNEPAASSSAESQSGYFDMSFPPKSDTPKNSSSFISPATSEDTGTYMMMGPSSGASSSGLSDSRRSTMSNSSYQSHTSGRDELPANSEVTYAVMEPVSSRYRSRDQASWDSNSSIGSSSYGWDRFSSFGLRPEHKLERVRAFMTADDQNTQLRETRAYSTGHQPSKPSVSFKTDLPTVSNVGEAFRTRAFSLGNHVAPTSSSKNQKKLIHSPSTTAIGNGVRNSSPLSARDTIRQVSTSDTQLNPESGASTPLSLSSSKPVEKKAGESSSRDDDMMEVVFRPKSG